MTVKTIVVGHGPSRKNFNLIKRFENIISVDTSAAELIQNGIMPKYVTSLEVTSEVTQNRLINLIPLLATSGSTIIHRREEIPKVIEEAKKYKVPIEWFEPPSYINNVGLFSIVFAHKALHSKEVHLVGMEHSGEEYPKEKFQSWINEFDKYKTNEAEGFIIDHSSGMLSSL